MNKIIKIIKNNEKKNHTKIPMNFEIPKILEKISLIALIFLFILLCHLRNDITFKTHVV